ncbi:MAG: hypothetical protein WBM03_11405 [Steroidobacteraceae bacterium]
MFEPVHFLAFDEPGIAGHLIGPQVAAMATHVEEPERDLTNP